MKIFWAICIHKLLFMTDTMWDFTQVKHLQCDMCFYLGQYQPSRRSRAPAALTPVLASPGIQMKRRLVQVELCDFQLMRSRIVQSELVKARLC